MLQRLRRLRYHPKLREMLTETHVSPTDLIMPVFISEMLKAKEEIQSMPGIHRHSIESGIEECWRIYKAGIPAVLLFGIPKEKDEDGSLACSHNSIIPTFIKKIKAELPELLIIADVCNCEYTTHGHCGTIEDGDVDNDKTLTTLAKQALVLAEAGADIIAPSDMMDGRVRIIREMLDSKGFYKIPILSYSVKYASAFYGPFRDAAGSAPTFGDRKTYQMNPANSSEAMLEAFADIDEGADMLMVKPALSYLDIITKLKSATYKPIIAYNVSGEYSMVKAAAEKGWINEPQIIAEILTSIKRAGADLIISYHALAFALHAKK